MSQHTGQVINTLVNFSLPAELVGKTIWEVFNDSMGEELNRTMAETHFDPLVNGTKPDNWDTVLDLGDVLSILPHIAGGI